jgi:hypothetical protein
MIEARISQHRMIVDADVDTGIRMGRHTCGALGVIGMRSRHRDDKYEASYARA